MLVTQLAVKVGPTSIGNSYDHFYNAYGSEGNRTLYFCSQLAVRERAIKDRDKSTYLFLMVHSKLMVHPEKFLLEVFFHNGYGVI
jgi:hypothetical protein